MSEPNKNIDHDTHWKEIITDLFPDFLAFFMPEAYKVIDFNRPIEFLDQELYKLVGNKVRRGKVINDKLVKVWLKDGTKTWILIHIEIQSTFEKGFAERMFTYFYRIFDNRGKRITAIAIYTGDTIPVKFKKYERELLGTKLSYEFNAYRVREAKEKELLKSDNPFALAVLAAKYLNESKGDADLRYRYKSKLIRLAKERNFTDKQIVRLLKFITFLMVLPSDMEEKIEQHIKELYLKSDDMTTLKSDRFANMLCLAVYGETLEEHANRKMIAAKTKSAEKLLRQTDFSVKQIADILDISMETVISIQSRLTNDD